MANDFSVVGSSYKNQLTPSYMLSIWIYPDGLSFSVFDPVQNEYVWHGHFSLPEPDLHFAAHEEIMLTRDVFRQEYRKVIVCYSSPDFTLVPKSLYDADKVAQLLSFSGHSPEKDCKILCDEIEMAGAKVIYPVPNFLYMFLCVQFQNLNIIHNITSLVQPLLMKRVISKSRATLSVEFSLGWVSIVATEANVLKICTSCRCRDVNDYVYMVMNALEQAKLNQADTNVIVSGDVQENDPRIELLRRFAHNVSVASLPDYFFYAFGVEEPQRFVNLFNMSLCV